MGFVGVIIGVNTTAGEYTFSVLARFRFHTWRLT